MEGKKPRYKLALRVAAEFPKKIAKKLQKSRAEPEGGTCRQTGVEGFFKFWVRKRKEALTGALLCLCRAAKRDGHYEKTLYRCEEVGEMSSWEMTVSSSQAHPPARHFGLFEKAKAIDATSRHLILLPIYVGQLHQRTSACFEHMLPGVRRVQRNRYFDPAVFRCQVI